MKKLTGIVCAGMLAAAMVTLPAHAAKKQLDPGERCSDVLQFENSMDRVMVGLWAFGYVSHATGKMKVVDPKANKRVLAFLQKLCDRNPDKAFSGVVEEFTALLLAKRATNGKTSRPDARKIIRRFLAPNADYAALTSALKPTPDDIQTVFAEPLAGSLTVMYRRLFKPGVKIRPKPEHTDFLSWQSTTRKLKNGSPDLRNFAGGMKKVSRFFIKNVPIVRFKFVKAGNTTGLVFDSLYYVNGRWVLMPKPWRALK
jgi:hypothetical protein